MTSEIREVGRSGRTLRIAADSIEMDPAVPRPPVDPDVDIESNLPAIDVVRLMIIDDTDTTHRNLSFVTTQTALKQALETEFSWSVILPAEEEKAKIAQILEERMAGRTIPKNSKGFAAVAEALYTDGLRLSESGGLS